MKTRHSILAIISLIFGLIAAFCALTRAGFLLVVAVPLGFAAIGTGRVAIRLIRKAHGSLRGKGPAVFGTSLGVVAVVSSPLGMVGMSFRQAEQQRRWQQAQRETVRLERTLSTSPLPDVPITNFTSNLPIVVLHTAGQSISKNSRTTMRAEFFDVHNGRALDGAKPDYAGLVTLNLRGMTTMNLPKRSYTLHCVDDSDKQIKVSLLGLPAEEDWVLYAPFEDKTLLRDVLAYELTRKMGHYAPQTRYVELFLHKSDVPLSKRDYAGVYVLIEKIKRSKERVAIAKLEPQHRSEPEITGGYIVKRDHGDSGDRRFNTDHGGPYFYVYPKGDQITAQQRSWLTRYFKAFESALYGDDFADPETGYAAYLDVDAFIDAHWLIEMGKNVDGFRYSAYLTKDRGGKIKAGPPWDWNRSFGNANYYGGWQPQGWYSSNLRPNEISWHHRLGDDPNFMRRCAGRWVELRRDVFDPKKINARIDELAAQLEEAQQRNFERWPILGQHVTCNHFVGGSYEEEVCWLKNWVERRIAWIDSQIRPAASL